MSAAPSRACCRIAAQALILLGPHVPTSYLAELAARMPLVVVARPVRHRAVDVIRTDDTAGLGLAVDHLVALRPHPHRPHRRRPRSGRRRTPTRLPRSPPAARAWPTPPSSCPAVSPRTMEPLRLAPCSRLTPWRPPSRCSTTAVRPAFSMSCAAPSIDVPGDISVVGFDDSRLAACRTSHSPPSRRTSTSSPASPSPAPPLGSTARPSPNVSWSSHPTSSSAARPQRPLADIEVTVPLGIVTR